MFYAAMNMNVISHNFRLVALDSKRQRDEICEFTAMKPISAKEAATFPQYDFCKSHPSNIADESKVMQGIVYTNMVDGQTHVLWC